MSQHATPRGRIEAGVVLSHYQIGEALGAGGMGVVYRAIDLKLNRRVAIKVIGHEPNDDAARQRFDWFDRFLGPVGPAESAAVAVA